MHTMAAIRGKHVLVMGLGVHQGGLGVTKWLLRHGAQVTVTDLKTAVQLKSSVRQLRGTKVHFVLGRHREKDFERADILIQNPAVHHDSPFLRIAKKRGIPILNEAALFFSVVRIPVIGVTGTKGKSTTTLFIGQFLKERQGRVATVGNIRHSFFTAVDRYGSRDRIVAELSSWHIEGMVPQKQSPHIAVLTNVYEDHLNRYPSFAAYAKTKAMLFAFQKKNDIAILNRDNAIVRKIGTEVPGRRYWFSRRFFAEENGAFLSAKGVMMRVNGKETLLVPKRLLPNDGRDRMENLLAALLAAKLAGAATASLRAIVPTLHYPSGRREVVRTLAGRIFINDTTATAPIATIQALQNSTKPILLIVGGENKQLSYVELAKAIHQHAARVFLLPGSASALLRKAFRKHKPQHVMQVKNVRDAVHAAWKQSKPGDTILLSPAAASFNQFAHEFERGDAFVKTVKQLKS